MVPHSSPAAPTAAGSSLHHLLGPPSRILVFPLAWKSHSAGLLKISLELSKRGYHITVLVPETFLAFCEEYVLDQEARNCELLPHRHPENNATCGGEAQHLRSGLQFVTFVENESIKDHAARMSEVSPLRAMTEVISLDARLCRLLSSNGTLMRQLNSSGFEVSSSS